LDPLDPILENLSHCDASVCSKVHEINQPEDFREWGPLKLYQTHQPLSYSN